VQQSPLPFKLDPSVAGILEVFPLAGYAVKGDPRRQAEDHAPAVFGFPLCNYHWPAFVFCLISKVIEGVQYCSRDLLATSVAPEVADGVNGISEKVFLFLRHGSPPLTYEYAG
jgi:hypothetical protein